MLKLILKLSGPMLMYKSMDGKKTIIFLSEMPITNGVIQAQLLPVVLAAAESGYRTEIIETVGRFDSQSEDRKIIESRLEKLDIRLKKIFVPRFTILPSIIYFSLKLYPLIKKCLLGSQSIIYARNYKFTPILIIASKFWKIPFIYSPRGAYVAERQYYRKIKDLLFAPFIAFLEKRVILRSFETIVETDRFKDHLKKIYHISGSSIIAIPNYYDAALLPDSFWNRDEMRKKLGFTDKKVIVYAGTLEVWYDFEKMIDLIAQLRKKDPQIFFQLFLKEDYARPESLGLLESLRKKLEEKDFREKTDFAISSYPSAKRYYYLMACDAGICLTIAQKFKTDMLYLKIVDFWGASLPVIVNQDISEAAAVILKSGAGAIVDYADWEQSVAQIELSKLFQKNVPNQPIFATYSSNSVIPLYLDLFARAFRFFG
jgi:glycosyltransferase involved in cell wall biosynthesis